MDGNLRIGIDASNIGSGGTVSHLAHLLAAADPQTDCFSEAVVWASSRTARLLVRRPWLQIVCPPELDGGLPRRIMWQQMKLPRALQKSDCNVLFSPGGTIPIAKGFSRHGCPAVAVSQNLLPFMEAESKRYKPSLMSLRLRLLNRGQSRSFKRASGVIFLTEYARSVVLNTLGEGLGQTKIVPHGIDERFFKPPRPQKPIEGFSNAAPFRLLYVSTVDLYKHQWNVARAVAALRQRGIPLEVRFVGSAYRPAGERLRRTIAELDPAGEFLHYNGPVRFSEIHSAYHSADGFVFASTCENMPNILLEAMASGLPIVCSNRSPMADILGNAGVYADPLSPHDVQHALEAMLADMHLRERCARLAHERARSYCWDQCTRDTFAFIQEVAAASHQWATNPELAAEQR